MIERISSKVDELERLLKELEDDIPRSFEKYLKNKRKYERLLHLCIESVIDTCILINKEESLGIPSDQESVFEKLFRKGIITKKMAENLKSMKGFRNILTHQYGEINDEIVYDNLTESRKDFYQFIEEVRKYLKRKLNK